MIVGWILAITLAVVPHPLYSSTHTSIFARAAYPRSPISSSRPG